MSGPAPQTDVQFVRKGPARGAAPPVREGHVAVLRHFQISPRRVVRALGAVDVEFDTFFLREVRRGGFQRFQALWALYVRRRSADEVLAQRVVRHALLTLLVSLVCSGLSDALKTCSRAGYEHSASGNDMRSRIWSQLAANQAFGARLQTD